MKILTLTVLSSLVLSVLILSSHSVIAHEYNSDKQNNQRAVKIIKKLAGSLGGVSHVLEANNQEIISKIRRFEPEQADKPGGTAVHITNIERSLIRDFNEPRSLTKWQLNNFYPTIEQYKFSEIINGQNGFIEGADGIFSAPSAPMRSTRLGARMKQYFISSPLNLVRWALNNRDLLRYDGREKFNGGKVDIVSMSAMGQTVKLFIDHHHLLQKVSTFEDDTIYGDANWVVTFSHWKKTHHYVLPHKLVHTLNSRLVSKEIRTNIHVNVALNDAMFDINDESIIPFNERQFQWGVRSSQWFTRLLSLGIPFDIDQTVPELVNIVEISPNVFRILGATHHSLLIEMDDYLVVVDPVLYDDRTQEIIHQVEARWPSKPIRYVIASHFHNDHIGGIRGYGEIGASVIVGDGTEAHYKAIFDSERTVYPDAYSKNQVAVEIITVDEDEPYFLSDGNRTIQIMDIANRHAKGLLVPYITDSKMAYVADLYNPSGTFGSPLPAQFDGWAIDLFHSLQEYDLDIESIVGTHGVVDSYDEFLAEIDLIH